jgi:hypothetical protein
MTEYERTAQTFDADAWMVGRITMVPYAGKAKVPRRASRQPIPRTDFVAQCDEFWSFERVDCSAPHRFSVAVTHSGRQPELTYQAASRPRIGTP